MSTIKSSAENLTLNADGANNDIKFQSNGSEVASVDQAGLVSAASVVTTNKVGIAVVPETWSIASALQIGADTCLYNDSGYSILSNNAYFNSGNKYINSGTANRFVLNDDGSMDFETAPSGSADATITFTERMRIHTNGVTSIPAGVALGVGTANTASNVLDDYEEGTWIPTLTGTSSGSFTTTAYRHLAYTKIGRVVHIQGYINVGSESSCSGAINMSLPFTASSSLDGDSENASINVMLREFSGSNLFNVAGSIAGANMRFVAVSGAGGDIVIDADDVDAVWNFRIGGSYIAA